MVSVLGAIVSIGILIALVQLYQNIIRRRLFLRGVPRIERPSRFFYGHQYLLLDALPGVFHLQLHAKQGPVVSYDGFFNRPRISITDKLALNHILLSLPSKFPKPIVSRRMLSELLGDGILVAEGADHTRQRRIMNPAFGPAHLKAIFGVFSEKAFQLRDVLMARIAESGEVPAELNFYSYASRVSLDVIASAGFGYETNAIEIGHKSDLARSFTEFSHTSQQLNPFRMLVYFFPILGYLPDYTKRGKALREAVSSMARIGEELVGQKSDAVLAQNGAADSKDLTGKDLLSILLKANMAENLKPSQRLTDKEVMAQISTFLLAGHDTTGTAMTWAIYALCKNRAVQDKLRAEILAFSNDHPTYEELNSLPYLDGVVRENLRLTPPVTTTSRMATEDCIIPLSEPIVKSDGSKMFELRIAEGTHIDIPIRAMANDPVVWGSDCDEFKPERWLSPNGVPDGAMEMPSIKFPTFLAGPRACIGFRFSVMEMKMVLFTLIRAMSFELTVDPNEIETKSGLVVRPRIKSKPEAGWQLPVLIRAL